jgi:DNA topoisomerase-2
MKPWYRGFTGEVENKTGKDCNNFSVLGRAEEVDENTVLISELPVGKWTTDYKQFLETVLIGGVAPDGPAVTPFIKDFKENHTDTSVKFTITVAPEKLAEIHSAGMLKKFKLEGSVATSNMHMFDLNRYALKCIVYMCTCVYVY